MRPLAYLRAGSLRFGGQDLVQDRRNVATKLFGIFTHRKMAELLHDGDGGAPDRGGGPFGVFGRAGEIILAGEQKEWAYFSIDLLDPSPQVAVNPIEIQIPLENTRPALLVSP